MTHLEFHPTAFLLVIRDFGREIRDFVRASVAPEHSRNGAVPMKRRPSRVLLLSTTVMVVQIGVVAGSRLGNGSVAGRVPLAIGDTLRTLVGVAGDGQPMTLHLATGAHTATVLYVFHSDCSHCRAVAPDWAAHFAEGLPSSFGIRRIAVTRESPTTGLRYANRFGWRVELISVSQSAPAAYRSLMARTPWVFVFDARGVLRFEGHGDRLDRVAEVLRALQHEANPDNQVTERGKR